LQMTILKANMMKIQSPIYETLNPWHFVNNLSRNYMYSLLTCCSYTIMHLRSYDLQSWWNKLKQT
jgi:hypothetical protein